MTEQGNMDWSTYNEIAKKQTCVWEKNVVMLRKAIQHIDDEDETLWKIIMPLLPGKRPTPGKGAKLVGLKAIIALRENIFTREDGFEALQKQKFNATEEWELCRKANGMGLGYSWDGFDYSGIDNNKLTMKWVYTEEEHFCYLANQTFKITESKTPQMWNRIKPCGKDGKYNGYCYVNSVDHFYTNLIWLIASGDERSNKDAYHKANTSGLLYAVADILHCGVDDNYELTCGKLRTEYLNKAYSALLTNSPETPKD